MATSRHCAIAARRKRLFHSCARLHELVVTVDHKKLGPDVHRLRTVLLRGGGLHGFGHPLAVGCAEQRSGSPRYLQPPLHHARHGDGLSGRHADDRRADELSRAVDDRRARYGFPAAQRVRFLDVSFRRAAALFQLSGRAGARRGRFGAGRGLVRLRAADRPRLLARAQHGLLDSQPAGRAASAASSPPSTSSRPSSACAAKA